MTFPVHCVASAGTSPRFSCIPVTKPMTRNTNTAATNAAIPASHADLRLHTLTHSAKKGELSCSRAPLRANSARASTDALSSPRASGFTETNTSRRRPWAA